MALDKPTMTLIEEIARAEAGEDMAIGIVRDLHEEKIDAQEVLDNLYKMEPPYNKADIARAMQQTLFAHRKK